MSTAWLSYVLLVGGLLALGAGAVASALRLAGRSTRWIWAAALVGIAALAIVAPRSRSIEIAAAGATITRADAPAERAVEAREHGLVAGLDAVRASIASATVRAITSTNTHVPATIARPLVIGWAVTSALLLVVYALVHLQLGWARGRWPLERVQGVPVRITPSSGPAVVGVMRAEIVVPRSLLQRSEDEQRLIIQHEHEHLRARDHLLLGLACLAVIVMPWHPAVWYLFTRLRLAIELDCDARVLRGGAPPRSYGALLIDMAAHGTGFRVGSLALADRPSHLERRLLAMSITRSRFMPVRAGALCAMAGLLVLAACEARIPTAAELTSMDVAAAEKAVASSGFSGRLSDADYFLNGDRMPRDELVKLDGRLIASMTVVKGKAQGGRDTIFIVTRDKAPLLDSQGNLGTKIRRAGTTVVGKDAGRVATEALRALDAKPAIMIDGKISTESALAALREADIVTVNIMKPAQQVAAGDAYPDGLIAIETKIGLRSQSNVKVRRASMEPSGPMPPTLRAKLEPAYQIDGAPSTRARFEALDSRDIVTVDVVKDKAVATALSDDPAAVNGLVRIATKRAKQQ